MSFEYDPTLRTLTATVKLLTVIAAHRLIVRSDYPELHEIAAEANRLLPDLVAAIGKLQAGRAPRRADD
jgi:hypothetical protein